MLSSIKSKLILWFLVVFSILFTALGLHLYHELEESVIGSVDDHLHSEVQLIAGLLDIEDGMHEVGLSEAGVGEYALPLSGHYYQVTDESGNIIARSPSLAIVDTTLPVINKSHTAEYSTITGPERGPLRLLSQTFSLDSMSFSIQAGETLVEAYKTLEEFREIFVVAFPLFFFISAGGIFIITRHSLGNLDSFSSKVGRITEKSLNERLDVNSVESELSPLASSFNTMMDRIEGSFEEQKRFLSDASHDLRTPTSVIKSHCDVTLSRERTAGEYVETLEGIRKTTDRMTNIINSILSAARLDSKAFSINMGEVDFAELVGDVINALEPKAKGKGVKLNISGKSLKLQGDREKLFEAFSALLDNAIVYNRSGGRVEMDTTEVDGGAMITITDTGIGIPSDERDKVFDRFYRADKSRGIVEGSGLGLSIVKSIIEAHGGRIDVESEEGKGSSFTIYLPGVIISPSN